MTAAPEQTPGIAPAVRKRAGLLLSVLRSLAWNVLLSALVIAATAVVAQISRGLAPVVLTAGAFVQMTRSYRRRWPLGVITCLLPPVSTTALYSYQLFRTSFQSPDTAEILVFVPVNILLVAIAAGLFLGGLLGRTHRVVVSDRRVVAAPTIGYLLLWPITFGVSLWLPSTRHLDAFAASLPAGGFSTGLVVGLSLVLFARYLQHRGSLSLDCAAVILCLTLGAGLIGLLPPLAGLGSAGQASGVVACTAAWRENFLIGSRLVKSGEGSVTIRIDFATREVSGQISGVMHYPRVDDRYYREGQSRETDRPFSARFTGKYSGNAARGGFYFGIDDNVGFQGLEGTVQNGVVTGWADTELDESTPGRAHFKCGTPLPSEPLAAAPARAETPSPVVKPASPPTPSAPAEPPPIVKPADPPTPTAPVEPPERVTTPEPPADPRAVDEALTRMARDRIVNLNNHIALVATGALLLAGLFLNVLTSVFTPPVGEGAGAQAEGKDQEGKDDFGGGEARQDDVDQQIAKPQEGAKPTGPTPEEREARKRKLHEIIAALAGMEDIDKRNQLIGIVRNAAQVDADGVPQGPLDLIGAMVRNQMNPEAPIGALRNILQQTGDFVQGVGKDVKDLGAAAIDAGKEATGSVGQAIKDISDNPGLIRDTWEITKENVGKGFDKAADEIGGVLKEISDNPGLIRDTWEITKENVSRGFETITNEASQLVKDIKNDPNILSETVKGTVRDLQFPNKVEQAIRDGVPGGESLLNATDPNKPVTERLAQGLKGAAELAATADSVNSVLEGGAKLAGKLTGEAAEGAVGVGERAVAKTVDASAGAEEAGAAVKTGRGAAEETGSAASEGLGKEVNERKQAWEQGREAGKAKVDELQEALKQQNENRSPENTARVRDALDNVQQDKHAMQVMNRSKNDGIDDLRKSFSEEIGVSYNQAHDSATKRIAEEFGVKPEDVKVVKPTNKPGEVTEPDPMGFASKPDGAKTTRGDDPSFKQSPGAKPENVKGDKVSFDQDVTYRVKQDGVDPRSGEPTSGYVDVPKSTARRIYEEEFYKARHDGELPYKIDAQGKSIIDSDKIHDYNHKMDQSITDRLDAEAYGTGDKDLQTATNPNVRGRDFTDVNAVAKTMEHKQYEWRNEANKMQDEASNLRSQSDQLAASGNHEQADALRGRAQELSSAAEGKIEEGFRQTTKQFKNQIEGRIAAANEGLATPRAEVPPALRQAVDEMGKCGEIGHSPAEVESRLRDLGYTSEKVVQQMSSILEALQKFK